MPSFGAIKSLQNRSGADRATCKKALADNDDDEDKAMAHIAATTDFKDSKAPEVAMANPMSNLSLADHEAGRPVLEQVTENTKVSIIRMEEGDRATYPAYGDTLRVHYTGKLQDDGTVFDSSVQRGKPFDFKVGKKEVIAGWDEALMKMSLGERAMILIPAAKAYGENGAPPDIPPHADLKFEIHLMQITRQTSCLGAGKHGGVQKESHEYKELADQLLGRAPPTTVQHNLPDDRQPMPLTSDMPRVDMLREHG